MEETLSVCEWIVILMRKLIIKLPISYTGHSKHVRQPLKLFIDNPELLIEELREDDVDWNDEFVT